MLTLDERKLVIGEVVLVSFGEVVYVISSSSSRLPTVVKGHGIKADDHIRTMTKMKKGKSLGSRGSSTVPEDVGEVWFMRTMARRVTWCWAWTNDEEELLATDGEAIQRL